MKTFTPGAIKHRKTVFELLSQIEHLQDQLFCLTLGDKEAQEAARAEICQGDDPEEMRADLEDYTHDVVWTQRWNERLGRMRTERQFMKQDVEKAMARRGIIDDE